jgi:hypothetical protein
LITQNPKKCNNKNHFFFTSKTNNYPESILFNVRSNPNNKSRSRSHKCSNVFAWVMREFLEFKKHTHSLFHFVWVLIFQSFLLINFQHTICFLVTYSLTTQQIQHIFYSLKLSLKISHQKEYNSDLLEYEHLLLPDRSTFVLLCIQQLSVHFVRAH